MFKWISQIFFRQPKRILHESSAAVAKIIDPWQGSGGYYVKQFRGKLDDIAQELSKEGNLVFTRFVRNLKCAEFYTPEGDVLA